MSRSYVCVVSLDVSQAASVADMTVAGRSIPSRDGKFSLYHHVQTISGVYTDGSFPLRFVTGHEQP